MEFWIFMLLSNLLIPLIMIVLGRIFSIRPPKEINSIFGYRTAMSMKNQETWIFAHKHCGRIWFRWGLVLLPLSILPSLFVIGESDNTIGNIGLIVSILQLVVLILSIFPTEKALKQHFDSKGNPK